MANPLAAAARDRRLVARGTSEGSLRLDRAEGPGYFPTCLTCVRTSRHLLDLKCWFSKCWCDSGLWNYGDTDFELGNARKRFTYESLIQRWK